MGLMTKWYNEKVTLVLPKAVGQLDFAKKYANWATTTNPREEHVKNHFWTVSKGVDLVSQVEGRHMNAEVLFPGFIRQVTGK